MLKVAAACVEDMTSTGPNLWRARHSSLSGKIVLVPVPRMISSGWGSMNSMSLKSYNKKERLDLLDYFILFEYTFQSA